MSVQDASDLHTRSWSSVAIAIPFLAGFSAAIGQSILLREAIVLFNGNELSLGIVLAGWMAWTAAGSGLAGWIVRDYKGADKGVRYALAIIECLCGFSLPLTILALREARAVLQVVPGEMIGPVQLAAACLVCISVFCALSGTLFALAAQMLYQLSAVSARMASSYAYLLDTAGFALGGIATSIVLLSFFGCIQIAFLVTLQCFCVGAILIFRSGLVRATTLAAAVMIAIPVLSNLAPRVEDSTLKHLWSGFQLLSFRDTMYGRINVIGARGMLSIYDNGSILANVPDPAAAEESAHYALLEHPAPKVVLVIGGGLNGSIAEALKHPTLTQLDYVEIDPALVAMYRSIFPRESAVAFADPRVRVHEADGRFYLESSGSRYDAILVNISDPANAQLNRFFTREFFSIARAHLAPGGLLALQVRASEDFISPELGGFLRCLHHTLQQIFPRVVVIPGETFHFFAARELSSLTEDPLVLTSRLKSRNLQVSYVREYFIPFRMMPDRMAQVHRLLAPRPDTPVNQDFRPVAYYFSAVLWSAQFSPMYAHLLEKAAQLRYPILVAGMLALFIASIWVFSPAATPQERMPRIAAWCVLVAGCTLITLQILILLTFQAVFGYLYRELALLIGMFIGGIAAGSWLGMKRTNSRSSASLVFVVSANQILLAAAAPVLLGIVSLLASSFAGAETHAIARMVFPLLAFFLGIPGGYQFPAASAIYLGARPGKTSLATLYALDLIGGCAGSLMLAGFLIPVFGFWQTAWITAFVNFAAVLPALRVGSKLAATTL